METSALPEVELDAQYRALREQAGFLARAERRTIAARGPDAAEYLQGQLTNEIETLAPGAGCYAALLDRKGHMQADMRVLRLAPDEISVETEAIAAGAAMRHLSMYKVGRAVEVEDVGGEWSTVSVIGPGTEAIVGGGPLGPEHAHRELELGPLKLRAIATDTGADLIVSQADLAALEERLRGGGADPVSAEAAEIIRVERGRPRFGREMTTATIPEEAGINDRAVSFTKGCYIGQETVARLHYRGKPNRHLRGLRLEAAVAGGDPVRLGERELGTIGTAVLSPAHGHIALAILRREAEPGASVVVGESIGAEVVELPF